MRISKSDKVTTLKVMEPGRMDPINEADESPMQ